MPHITIAMKDSLTGGTGNAIMYNLLRSRTITEQVSSVKNTFSSWDTCMSQDYCKWPAIVAIIISSLIVLSVLTCIIRCMCLGYSCCCTCFSCLKCCACCGGCCDGRRSRPMNYMDEPQPYATKGYQAPIPMMMGVQEAPKFARFSVAKNRGDTSGVSEDALPPMPSWDSASKKHILTEEEEESAAALNSSTAQNTPLVAAAAATGMSSPSLQARRDPAPFPPRPTPSSTPVNGLHYNSPAGVPPRGYAGSPGPQPPVRGYTGSPGPQPPVRGYTGSPGPQASFLPNGPGYTGPPAQLPRHPASPSLNARYPPDRMGSPASFNQGYPQSPDRPTYPSSNYQPYNRSRGPPQGPAPTSGYRAYQ